MKPYVLGWIHNKTDDNPIAQLAAACGQEKNEVRTQYNLYYLINSTSGYQIPDQVDSTTWDLYNKVMVNVDIDRAKLTQVSSVVLQPK